MQSLDQLGNVIEVGDIVTYHFGGSTWDGDTCEVLKIIGDGREYGLQCRNQRTRVSGILCSTLVRKDKFISAARKVKRESNV